MGSSSGLIIIVVMTFSISHQIIKQCQREKDSMFHYKHSVISSKNAEDILIDAHIVNYKQDELITTAMSMLTRSFIHHSVITNLFLFVRLGDSFLTISNVDGHDILARSIELD